MGNSESSFVYMLTCHFNPTQSEVRKRLATKFLAQFSDDYFQRTRVIMVECALNDSEFELKAPNSKVTIIQVRTNSIMWLKENLLNKGLQSVPKEANYIAWSDADINFLRQAKENFQQRVVSALEKYSVAQLFEYAHDLDPQGQTIGECESFGSFVAKKKPISREKYSVSYPHPGYCWAANKAALAQGFFDVNIIGNGDKHMAFAFLNRSLESYPANLNPLPNIQNHLEKWEKIVFSVTKGKVGFVDQPIQHNWHGNKIDRGYNSRWNILVDIDFNLNTYVTKNQQGIFQFTDVGKIFQDRFQQYFQSRKEDSVVVEKLNYPKVVKEVSQIVKKVLKPQSQPNQVYQPEKNQSNPVVNPRKSSSSDSDSHEHHHHKHDGNNQHHHKQDEHHHHQHSHNHQHKHDNQDHEQDHQHQSHDQDNHEAGHHYGADFHGDNDMNCIY